MKTKIQKLFLLAAAAALLAPAACVQKAKKNSSPRAGEKCNCPKAKTATASVKAPKGSPSCQQACEYLVHCQARRWDAPGDLKQHQERCINDCKSATGEPNASLFASMKKCAVDNACVKFGSCFRSAIAAIRDRREDPNALYKVPVAGSPMRGDAKAPVTIVVFADYRCGYCRMVRPTIKKVEETYGKKVRVVYKHYPLGPASKQAALASLCVLKQKGSAAFWKFHDGAYAAENHSDETIKKLAASVGADTQKLTACLDAKDGPAATLEADTTIARNLGVDGTPAFFINGHKMVGAQPLAEFKRVIDDSLKTAEAALKSGVAPEKVYAHVTAKGHTKVKFIKGAPRDPHAGHGHDRPKEIDPTVVFHVPLTKADPIKGAKAPLVTIVEYADFECPACSHGAAYLAKLVKEFPNDVRVIFRNMPLDFHPNAALAAQAALAVRAQKGDAGYYQYHDTLFQNQKALTRPDLVKYAKALGVDLARFNKDLDQGTFKSQVEADMKLAGTLGVRGTPAYYINGKFVSGVPPSYDLFKARVVKAMDEAKKKIAAGTPRAKLYEAIIKGGKTEAVYAK